MNALKRLNDWCGDVLNKIFQYNEIMQFVAFSILFIMFITLMVSGILSGLGYTQ
jgi:hypothetical protein